MNARRNPAPLASEMPATATQEPLLLADRTLDLVEALGDLVQLVLDRGQPGRYAVAGVVDRVCWCWWGVSEQHRGQVSRVPAEGHRQSFERAAAASSLDGVVADLAHDGQRDVRALRELALIQPK